MNDFDIKGIHEKSMDEAFRGELAKRKGNRADSLSHFKTAYDLEAQVVNNVLKTGYAEPGRSILIKSCAALAIEIGDYLKAEQLVCNALSGDPPVMIRDELRNMYEDVTFNRHLNLKGLSMQQSEIQISLAGNGVSYGMGPVNEITSRIDSFNRLVIRFAEMNSNMAYRKNGRVSKLIEDQMMAYISVPRAASFSFSIKYSSPYVDALSQDFCTPIVIVKKIIENIALIENSDYKQIEANIPDANYRDNFINQAKELAPDGDRINLIGFTYLGNNGKVESVPMRKTRDDITCYISSKKSGIDESSSNIFEDITGTLMVASGLANDVVIVTKGNKRMKVSVSDGLDDIVHKYFNEEVKVKLKKVMKRNELVSIDPITN